MKRVRVQLVWLTPAAAALFVLTVAAPRSALLYHEHAGGTRAHSHADSDDLADLLAQHEHEHGHDHDGAGHDHGHHRHHHHHDIDVVSAAARHSHSAPLGSARAVLLHNNGSANGHWHEQLRFNRAVIGGLSTITVSALVAPAPQPRPQRRTLTALQTFQARAPPHFSPFA